MARSNLLRVLHTSSHHIRKTTAPVLLPSVLLPHPPRWQRDRSFLPLCSQSIDRSNFFPLKSFHLRSNLAILRVPSTETYTFPPFFGGLALFAATMFAASPPSAHCSDDDEIVDLGVGAPSPTSVLPPATTPTPTSQELQHQYHTLLATARAKNAATRGRATPAAGTRLLQAASER